MHRIPRRSGALVALTALAALPLGLPVAAAAAATADPTGSPAQTASSDRSATTAEERRDRRTRTARVKPGTTKGAKVAKLGWWSRSNEQLPETGLAAPPSVPAAAAPEGSYPVAQVAGDAERITAIELRVKGKTGSLVKSVRLSLSEADNPAGSPNAASAAIVACPMTEVFWQEIENGPWGTRPSYDCSLGSVPGARDDEGVWTFDLTSLASDWLSEDRSFAPAVVLVGAAAAAADGAEQAPDPATAADQGASSFQVAFQTGKGLGVVATTGPGADDPEDPDTTEDPETTDGSGGAGVTGGTGGTGGGAGLGSGDLGGGDLSGSGADLGPAPDGGDPVALDDAAAAADGAEAAGAPASPSLAPVSSGPLPWHAGLGGRLLLLLPALLLAYLVMVAMGPNAQPVVGGGRRGVSRALDKVAAATPLRFGRKSS